MKYQNRVVWLKDFATREDYSWMQENIGDKDDTGASPGRYLNPSAYFAYLTLVSLTTRICQVFQLLGSKGEEPKKTDLHFNKSKSIDGWKDVRDYAADSDHPTGGDSTTFKFKKAEVFQLGSKAESVIDSFSLRPGSAVGNSYYDSAAIYNAFDHPLPGFLESGDIAGINTHGLIFKFNEKLAIPDTNLIGDIIGRHFLSCLGGTIEEQFENLEMLKSGISALRLTRVGDEMAHLYKCIDVAIQCQSGCVPFFNGNSYEGSVILGGFGAQLLINGTTVVFDSPDDLKTSFLLVSDHATAISFISNKFPVESRDKVRQVTSMAGLWSLCLDLECTADDRDYIIQKAADLDYGLSSWVINPANLKAAFLFMSNPLGKIAPELPISRLCLFSKDPVLLALSCFGEKSCPSWDIPGGVNNSLAKPNPPTPPAVVKFGTVKSGATSDATWIMVVRTTDLFSAADDLRRMAKDVRYRSTPSVVAKKVGHRVFSRDRMAEFWREMQSAYRLVNPNAKFEGAESSQAKRPRVESGEAEGVKKLRRLAF
jgi:hypothetical protein